MKPTDVVLALLDGVSARRWSELPELYAEDAIVEHPLAGSTLRGRGELAEHFRRAAHHTPPMRADAVVLHETTDPEVVIAEFAYVGDGFTVPAVFVVRVRDGLILASRDYIGVPRATMPDRGAAAQT